MSFTLCMMTKPVLTFDIENDVPKKIVKIDDERLLPVALKNNCTPEALANWLNMRSIPDGREGYDEIKSSYGDIIKNSKLNYLSLTDPYWVKRRLEDWRKINLYDNSYNTFIGDATFTPWDVDIRSKGASADATTGGMLKKMWRRDQGERVDYLIKAGSAAFKSEPLHEVLVSAMLEKMKDFIPFVRYDLCVEGLVMCCKCPNFIHKGEALVPASDFYFKEKRAENESVFDHLVKMCKKEKIPGAKEFIEKMIVIDELTGNIDRNLGNIGFIYDAEKGVFKGPAPLYDNGDSYKDTKVFKDRTPSKLFGDVERGICDRYTKNIDLSFMEGKIYKKLIYNYPGISEAKRSNLITAIENMPSLLKGRNTYVELGEVR